MLDVVVFDDPILASVNRNTWNKLYLLYRPITRMIIMCNIGTTCKKQVLQKVSSAVSVWLVIPGGRRVPDVQGHNYSCTVSFLQLFYISLQPAKLAESQNHTERQYGFKSLLFAAPPCWT